MYGGQSVVLMFVADYMRPCDHTASYTAGDSIRNLTFCSNSNVVTHILIYFRKLGHQARSQESDWIGSAIYHSDVPVASYLSRESSLNSSLDSSLDSSWLTSRYWICELQIKHQNTYLIFHCIIYFNASYTWSKTASWVSRKSPVWSPDPSAVGLAEGLGTRPVNPWLASKVECRVMCPLPWKLTAKLKCKLNLLPIGMTIQLFP